MTSLVNEPDQKKTASINLLIFYGSKKNITPIIDRGIYRVSSGGANRLDVAGDNDLLFFRVENFHIAVFTSTADWNSCRFLHWIQKQSVL